MSGRRDEEAEKKWLRNFHKMSAGFGVISSVNVIIGFYTSSILGVDNDLSFIGPAILYACWLVSSLCFSSQAAIYFGTKKAMLLGFLMADSFYVAFTIAAALEDGLLKAMLILVGNSASGIGAGLFWTAEGAYFARSAELMAEASGGKLEDHTNSMSAIFASWNFIAEVLLALMVSAIQLFPQFPQWISMGIACTTALVFTAFMAFQMETLPERQPKAESSQRTCVTVVSLWRDPALWLLSFMNMSFGFAAALLNGKINGAHVAPQLGTYAVGLLSALMSFTALAAQWPYDQLVKSQGKLAVMWLGTGCFAVMACGALWLPLSSMGYWLTVFFILMALGRAAYESTNRAIFADFFPPPKSEDAFANVSVQQAIAFTAAFLLQTEFDLPELGYTLLVLALLIMPGVFLAYRARAKAPKEDALVQLS